MADLPAVLQSEIERRLQRRQRSGEVTILDGGTGTCLWELLGGTTQSTLWSARLLADNPLAIYNVGLAFVSSGSEILTTATYQAHVEGYFKELGCSVSEAAGYMLSGVHVADRARSAYVAQSPAGTLKPLLALSCGPFGATLNDYSEYHGNYPPPFGPSAERYAPNAYPLTPLGEAAAQRSEHLLCDWHLARLRIFLSDPATSDLIDVLFFETIPLLREIRAIRAAVSLVEAETGRHWPFMISACLLKSKVLETGANMSDLTDALLADFPSHSTPGVTYAQPLIIGLNCMATYRLPDIIDQLATAIKSHYPGRNPHLALYPNNNYEIKLGERDWAEKMMEIKVEAQKTEAFGAIALGGCCGTVPKDIALLNTTLHEK